jgi:hypothetical protein
MVMDIDMDKLFRALPRDLQWEVLTEFTGTHVVRNGKLRRKIVYSTMGGSLVRHLAHDHFVPAVNGLRVRVRLTWLHDRPEDARPKYIRFTILGNRQMQFCDDGITGDTTFGYRKTVDYHILWEMQYPVVRAEDAVVLPPFVRHDYPSYEHTDKKRRITLIR